MGTKEDAFSCSGLNGALTIYRDRLLIKHKTLGFSKSYQLPINRITSIIIERKSVMPFATLTVLAAAMTLVTKYNAIWFLVNLSPRNTETLSSAALFVTVLSAIPTLFRIFFVNVEVTWDGDPTSFRVGFVRGGPGKRLATRFHELPTWS